MNMALYFHSSIADYYLGIWGGGVPKPFKFTEIQRHRLKLYHKIIQTTFVNIYNITQVQFN